MENQFVFVRPGFVFAIYLADEKDVQLCNCAYELKLMSIAVRLRF